MKKINLIFLFLFMFIFVIINLSNALALDVDIVGYNPYPTKPAESFIAQFQIENNEDIVLENITLNLDVSNPFSLLSSDEQFIESLMPGQIELIEFIIYVEGSANPGEYEIELNYKVGDEDWRDKEFKIKVREKEVFLEVISVKSIPEKISPSEEAEVKIKIRNNARSLIKDITIKLDLSGEIPFAPISSTTEKRIDELYSGEEKEIIFNIIALQNAELKTYKVPLQIEYYDEYGEKYTKQDLISLLVSSEPQITVKIEKSELIEGMRSKVKIKILNTGLGGADFLNIQLFELSNYEIISSDEEYIGQIDSDDYETIEFELIPRKAGNILLQGIINYRDSNNKEYSEQITLSVKVYSIGEAKNLGLIKTNYTFLFVSIAALLIICFFLYRKWKRKKNASRLS